MNLERTMVNICGNIKHGHCGTLTYSRWKSMMARCYQVNASNYKYYGLRGIKVCDRWHDFSLFLADMGECPNKAMTLDRINNDIGYELINCRWATKDAQNKNRSYCRPLTFNGETKNISEWAFILGIRPDAISQRLKSGWAVEKILTTPVKKRKLNE